MRPKCRLESGVLDWRTGQHDDVQGLDVVVLKEVLFPKIFVKTVKGGLKLEDADAVEMRLLAEKIDDWIRSVFLFVIVSNHPRHICAHQIQHQEESEQARANPRALTGEIPGERDRE